MVCSWVGAVGGCWSRERERRSELVIAVRNMGRRASRADASVWINKQLRRARLLATGTSISHPAAERHASNLIFVFSDCIPLLQRLYSDSCLLQLLPSDAGPRPSARHKMCLPLHN
jgi:hypothetical protein